MNRHAPDLMGTQEGTEPSLMSLRAELPALKLAYTHRSWIEDRMYPGIFYNPKKLVPLDSGDIWLSKTPYVPGSSDFDSAWPRLATWTLFRHTSDCGVQLTAPTCEQLEDILFVNTHLDHVLPYTRHEQIKVLLQEIQPLLKNNPLLVLAGDFNEAPTENVRREIDNGLPHLRDPWYAFGKKEETTTHKFRGYIAPSEGGNRIDWVLADDRLTPLNVEIDKSSTDDGVYPSDHYPVIATFSF